MILKLLFCFLCFLNARISDEGIKFLLDREGFNLDNIINHTENEKLVWIFLKKEGLTDAGAAGLMGNLQAESKIESIIYENSYKSTLGLTDQEYVDKVNNGEYANFTNDKVGFGLAQWTYYTRKQGLLNMCKSQIGDLDCQLNYLIYEFNTDYKQILTFLQSSNDIYECTVKVMVEFENPADQSEQAKNNRYQISKNYCNDFTFGGFTNEIKYTFGGIINDLIEVNQEEALNLIRNLIIYKYEHLVDRYDLIYHFNQNQYDALISFAYNVGNITQLTNDGLRSIEEISSHFLDYIYDKKGNIVKGRRELEKQLFEKSLNLKISKQLKIMYYFKCSSSDIFTSILSENKEPSQVLTNYQQPQDIGVIFYDSKTGKSMKTLCQQFYIDNIDCWPYYPIQEGEYIIKLEKNGYFNNGVMVLPFDLTDNMYSKKIISNKEIIEDRRVKVYNLNFQLPLYIKYSERNYLYGNFFFYHGRISLYNKNEIIINNNYPVEVQLIYCYLNNSCNFENKYKINCQINKQQIFINLNNDFNGEYLLRCKGLINTNVYNIENFGGHIELKYKVGESSIQNITFGLLLNQNFVSKSPRDILEVTSYTYKISKNNIIFEFLGNSLNNKNIREIGSRDSLVNFEVYFYSFYYTFYTLCYLYNNNLNTFIIRCQINSYYFQINETITTTIYYAKMEREFIHEQNNQYDIILPFEFNFVIYLNIIIDNNYYYLPEAYNCNDVKNGATIHLCSSFNGYDIPEACIKEGDSCVLTNECTKVKFFSYYCDCSKLNTKSNNNICYTSGGECVEINKEKYKNAINYNYNYNDYENDDNNNIGDDKENRGSNLKKKNKFDLYSFYFILLFL